PVCLEDFGKQSSLERAYTECGHMFCKSCLTQALSIKPLCPMCRSYQKSLTGSATKPTVARQAQPPPEIQAEGWGIDAVRTVIFGETGSDGLRPVLLKRTDGKKGLEETSIRVRPGAFVVSPNANIVI